MAKEDWQELLELMYEHRVIVDPKTTSGWMSSEDTSISLGAAKQFHEEVVPKFDGNIEESMERLRIMGFATTNDDFSDDIPGLTGKGWKFAHQMKTEGQRHHTNMILTLGTILISASNILF